ELVAELAEEERRVGTERLRVSVRALLVVSLSILLLPLMDVRSWNTLALTYGTLGAVTLIVWRVARGGRPNPAVNMLVGFVLAVAFTRVLGPFVLTPIVIAASLLPMTANPWLNTRPLAVAGWLLAVVFVPQLLEWLGVFTPTWSMVAGGVCSTSAMLDGRSSLDAVELLVTNLLLLGTVAAYMVRINRAMIATSQKLHVQAWQLGQLLPKLTSATRPRAGD
ncbi:MAG: hypothetical protein NT062_32090, partial [Proteobacteria bacterium]|nr:hypothetical protein [Pseudomonadota bacterium]